MSFDNGEALNEVGSPQDLAYEWMLSDPTLGEYSSDRILQRFALATFYYSTGGDAWEENNLWLTYTDECEWFSRTASYPVCKSNQMVTLELDFNNLQGSLPADLALLSRLERVELSGGPDVYLSGQVPSELGLLTSLDSFSLRGNQLSGSVPSELGQWSLVRTLNLSLNRFGGKVPVRDRSSGKAQRNLLGDECVFRPSPF